MSSQVLEGGKDKAMLPQLEDEVLKPSNQEQEPWAESTEKLQPVSGKTSTASRAKGTKIIQMQGPQVLSHRVTCWKSGISYLDTYCMLSLVLNGGKQDAQEGVKGQNGMVKDNEFHFGSRKKTFCSSSNAGGKFGFEGSGKIGRRSGKRNLSVTESWLGNGLGGPHCGNSMALKIQVTLQGWWLCHLVDRWDVTELLCLQKPEKQQAFLRPQQQVTPWTRHTAVQKSDLVLRSSPRWPSWGQSEPLSSVSTVLCMLRVRQAGPRLGIWE